MSSILQKQVGITSASVTLTLNNETFLVYSGRVEATYQTIRTIIKGWMNVSTGTTLTSIILSIRRGNGIAGALVATRSITSAPSITDEVVIEFTEQLLNIEFADYSLTAQQQGAGTNGTVFSSVIEVETING